MKIGFIGIGHMGGYMAAHLVNAGHSLVIYDGLDMRVLSRQEKTKASDYDI